MELLAAEPLYGKSSSRYLRAACTAAALMYAAGQRDESKMLARQLLPLAQQFAKEEPLSQFAVTEDKEAILQGILNDDKNIVLYEGPRSKNKIQKYFDLSSYSDMDSIGRWLEEAYGEVYLDKRLDMPERLPSAYRNLGWAQAVSGNYDESDRAYRTALSLAEKQYGDEHHSFYPEIILQIKSEYAAMLKIASKTDASAERAAKLAEGLTPKYLDELKTKADADWLKHPDSIHSYSNRPVPCEWQSEQFPF